jgi:hypothetical protein
MNIVENCFPELFVTNILNIFLDVNYVLVLSLDCHDFSQLPLLRQAVHNLREIITTNETAAGLLEGKSLEMLKKCVDSFKTEET